MSFINYSEEIWSTLLVECSRNPSKLKLSEDSKESKSCGDISSIGRVVHLDLLAWLDNEI